jgi:hypothetical protein
VKLPHSSSARMGTAYVLVASRSSQAICYPLTLTAAPEVDRCSAGCVRCPIAPRIPSFAAPRVTFRSWVLVGPSGIEVAGKALALIPLVGSCCVT